MVFFDVSRDWVILAPVFPAARTAAAELSHYIELLRNQAGLSQKAPRVWMAAPAVEDAAGPAPGDSVPIIVLNADTGGPERSGFTWRLGRDRVEIYGDSGRGLCNGVFDFLAGLGIRWPMPGREELPNPPAPDGGQPASAVINTPRAAYLLHDDRAYVSSNPAPENRRRLLAQDRLKPRELEALLKWVARNRIDALVVSLREKSLREKSLRKNSQTNNDTDNNMPGKHSRRRGIFETAENYDLIIEWGGWDLSLLVPRRYFFINRELFRMDSGKRLKQYNFCPTNHETINVLKKQSAVIFHRFRAAEGLEADKSGQNRIYHLWPDRGQEKTWCSCPACRAFSPEEQNRIAVNAVADALAEVDPQARLSWYEAPSDSPESEIPLRKNLFRLTNLPEPACSSGTDGAGRQEFIPRGIE